MSAIIGQKYYENLDEVLPAIAASVLALVIVSLLTQNNTDTKTSAIEE